MQICTIYSLKMDSKQGHNQQAGQQQGNHVSWLQQWLERVWYENGAGRWVLLPLAGLYCLINVLHRWKDSRNRPLLSCPVIVVGNITVGGTGKTPLTIHLVKLLQEAGYNPGIITRGYGGKTVVWPQVVTAESDPSLVGDEAVLMAYRTGAPVCAGPHRLDSVAELREKFNCDVIISDDGMQHYKLPRDIQLAVVDGKRLLGNGYCLPAGPLRERKHRLNRSDLIVLNGAEPENHEWHSMFMEGDILVNLKTGEKKSLSSFTDKHIHAVTGIGNPKRFYQTLEKAGLKLTTHIFPDHHDFKETDCQFADSLPIIMTEKDAVKCKSFANDTLWFLPINAKLEKHFDEMFLMRINTLMS